jgi:uroporphyrinogen decarboxylase
MRDKMTSMERVLNTLSGKNVDQTPLFFLFSIYGAKEVGCEIQAYFKDVDLVVETQLAMQRKYASDCLYTFQYASLEYEAFGGTTIFYPEAPPNAGEPLFSNPETIDGMTLPVIESYEGLQRVLNVTEKLKNHVGDQVPIIGVVMAPFSLPVMQMGFESYLNLIIEGGEQFDRLMKINQAFCIDWANRQLQAGATAICYFNPLASNEMVNRQMYVERAFELDCDTIARINGPTAMHFASARTIPTLDLVERTGTQLIGISSREKISEVKSKGKMTVLGNLDGILMRKWTQEEIQMHVTEALEDAGQSGRLILSDNHGEIPWQIPSETLLTIAETVKSKGNLDYEK